MPLTVHCPCGKQFQVPDEWAGKRGKCKVCGRELSVPVPSRREERKPLVAVQTFEAKTLARRVPSGALEMMEHFPSKQIDLSGFLLPRRKHPKLGLGTDLQPGFVAWEGTHILRYDANDHLTRRITKEIGPAALSSCLGFIVAPAKRGAKGLCVWDLASGREVQFIPLEGAVVNAVALTAGGKRIAVAANEAAEQRAGASQAARQTIYRVEMLDAASAAIVATGSYHTEILEIAMAPDEQTLLTGSHLGLALWDAETVNLVAEGSQRGRTGVAYIAYARDSHRALSATNETIAIWDLA
jgi:hypothetical protein